MTDLNWNVLMFDQEQPKQPDITSLGNPNPTTLTWQLVMNLDGIAPQDLPIVVAEANSRLGPVGKDLSTVIFNGVTEGGGVRTLQPAEIEECAKLKDLVEELGSLFNGMIFRKKKG